MTFGPRFALVEPIHPAGVAFSQGWMGAEPSSERRCRTFRRWCDCRGLPGASIIKRLISVLRGW